MSESSLLGPQLTPPRDGLFRLQQSVSRQAHRHFHVRTWVAAGVAAGFAVMSLVFVLHGAVRQHRMNVAVRQAFAAASQTHIENGAYQELPSHDPDVKILLIGVLNSQQSKMTDTQAD